MCGHKHGSRINLTPANPMCNCFQQNAVRTLGSACFARSANTFGGRGVKKHHLLKYVVESCPNAVMPYGYGAGYEQVRSSFAGGTPGGKWTRVTGIAQVGDIIVDGVHMQMITSLGKYPILLSDGRKLSKVNEYSLWKAVKDAAGGAGNAWRTCAAWTDTSGHIDPSGPRDQCSAKPWTQVPQYGWVPGYWFVVRAAKTRVINDVPDINKQGMLYFRYLAVSTEDQAWLDLHNAARRILGASNMWELGWDSELARAAEEWAGACDFKHGQPAWVTDSVGQNLAFHSADSTPGTAVNLWEAEKSFWTHGNTLESSACQPGKTCGHFTQVAWAATKKIGCATVNCTPLMDGVTVLGNGYYTVCNYSPAGNAAVSGGNSPPVYEIGTPCSGCAGSPTCNQDLCV